jgi:hypothetical protein
MLSGRLVRLIEANWQEITSRLIREVKSHPDMKILAATPDADLREWCQEMLEHLGQLLTVPKEQEAVRRFEAMGMIRFEENVPLHEAVLRFHLLREKIVGFVHEQGYAMTGVQIYAEAELEERISAFCDACVYHVVRGYEKAMLRAGRLAS